MKLTITDKVYVPVSLQIEDIPSQKTTVFMYDAYRNQIEPYWLKEETNKYVLSEYELRKIIIDAMNTADKYDYSLQSDKEKYINSIL